MSDKAEALTRGFPDTPAARQLAWWLTMLIDQGEGASPADWDRYAPELRATLGPLQTAEAMREAWRANAARFGEIGEVAIEPTTEFDITAVVRAAKDRRWAIRVTVTTERPHRMARFEVTRRHDFQLGFREAGPDDALLLADLESRCPIVMGDTSVHFERGENYYDPMRLMEDSAIGLASVDGAPAAVSCGAERVVRVGGELKKMVTVSHLRVLPEHQRKGLWGAANKVLDRYWDHVDGSQAYISVDNLAMQHGFTNTPNKWGQIVQRVELDTAALSGPAAGRAATAADADAIVARLNAFHGDEELFVPYTRQSFAARVERAPDLYAWDKIWMTDRALVGVWPAGRALRVVTTTPAGRSVSVSAVVLDYAFDPGAAAELEALLRAWCSRLAAKGMDTLVIYTSPASPGAALIARLARSIGGFFMWTPGIPVPPGAETRGLYTDAIYF
ncbi:MAG TPA: hypothetical protein VME40_08495 [Caulobacteraceae bacterium]|nr:hypothetical protein [Caulobacteraceae bacterium]